LGSFNRATYKSLYIVIPIIILGSVGLMLVSWRLNVLSMGDDEARSMGVKTESLKFFIIACTTLITASAVSVSGIVGWVGLVIPHVGRMISGPNHRWLLPTSMALGAVFLLVVDDIARTATPLDIPIGILTGLIGAPFFAYLLRRTKGGWK
jgi:iron complex transport system permease protein